MKILKVIAASIMFLLTLTCAGYAEERFNFGEKWTKSGIPEKGAFFEGYQSGYILGVMNATKNFLPTDTEKEKESAFKKASMIFSNRRFGKDMAVTIILVMDQLYRDPANGYIDKGAILELAIAKIRGSDISEDLVAQRKAALGEAAAEK